MVEERCGEDPGVRGGECVGEEGEKGGKGEEVVWRCIFQGLYFTVEMP